MKALTRHGVLSLIGIVTATFTVCEAQSPQRIPSKEQPCRKGFLLFGKACYKYRYDNVSQMNFADANIYCNNLAARLADVDPSDANSDVIEIIRRNGYREMNYWINLNDTLPETAVSDRNATILASRCVVIGAHPNYVIRSVTCNSRHLFVCQHDPIKTISVQRSRNSAYSCFGKYGYFPHPTDCRKYILCFNGNKNVFRCSRGQVFSELARRCRAGTECEDPIPHDGGDGNRNVHLDDNSQNDSDQEARNTNRNEEHPMICESGAKRHQTKCFKIYDKRMSWENADSFCKKRESRLVTISNLKQMKFLKKIINRRNTRLDYWIGLNDKIEENVFVWSDGKSLSDDDYNLWAKRSRRRFNAYKDCVKLDKRARYRWLDASCSEKNFFICEKAALRGWKEPNPDCGLFYVRGQPRVSPIIGGTHAFGKKHPWQVSLRFEGDHKCGGSLIDNCWVLTAAHCVSLPDVAPPELPTEAILGDFNLVRKENSEERLKIERVFVHPDWAAYPVPKNDIAILKLKNCSKKHNPICLPTSRSFSFPPDTRCNVAGYGTINPKREVYPNVLMEATVPLIPTSICRSLYKHRRNPRKSLITSAMFCAGYKDGGIDACQGDSGGPLTCENTQNQRETQWGIVSWGNGCAEANKPGVYTKVVHFFDWIRNVTMVDF